MSPSKNIAISFFRVGVKLIWVLLCGSCLAPIDFSTENIGGRLVVSGQISPIQDQNFIQVGLTADKARLPFPLSGASITLLDDAGESYSYTEDFSSPGLYFLTGVSGIPQRTYHIQVTTPDEEVYESTPEKMPESVGQLTTSYEILFEEFTDFEGTVSIDPFIKIYAHSLLPATAEPSYLKWGIEEVFRLSPTDFPDPFGSVPPSCYIVQNADPQRIELFNGADLKTTSIDNLLVGSRIVDWTFLERHYFTTYQSSLTKEAYEYWRQVDIVSNQVGSIFDTPPAEIKGNIFNVNDPSENVLGYFQAANQTFDRFFLIPFNLPFPLTPVCNYDASKFQYEQRCLDCLIVRNSSYRRPDWF